MFIKPIEHSDVSVEDANPPISKAEERRQLMHAKLTNTDRICRIRKEHDPLVGEYNCQFDQ